MNIKRLEQLHNIIDAMVEEIKNAKMYMKDETIHSALSACDRALAKSEERKNVQTD